LRSAACVGSMLLRRSSGCLALKSPFLVTVRSFKKKVSGTPMFEGYPIEEAVRLVKAYAVRHFEEGVEVSIMTGCDPRKAAQTVKGVLSLPHGSGKKIRVAVFAKDAKAIEAKEAGADIVGGQDLADQITAGNIDFERCYATPDMMGVVGKVARILGPRGLMPNPKMGSVTVNIKDAVAAAKLGSVQFRCDKEGAVRGAFGKAMFPAKHLQANLEALLNRIRELKPEGANPTSYLKKVVISSTMGPGVKVKLDAMV